VEGEGDGMGPPVSEAKRNAPETTPFSKVENVISKLLKEECVIVLQPAMV
jgi:hypothetical protein